MIDQIGAVESVKAASDIVESLVFCSSRFSDRIPSVFFVNHGAQYAPVSGTIREINESLNDQPGLLNRSPEEEGMLVNQPLLNSIFTGIARMALQN